MRVNVYTSSLNTDEVEDIFKSFRGDFGWSGYNNAKQEKTTPRIWAIGSHADNDPAPKDFYVRIDDGRIIANQAGSLIEKFLIEGKITHQKYTGIEIDESDLFLQENLELILNNRDLYYSITFNDSFL